MEVYRSCGISSTTLCQYEADLKSTRGLVLEDIFLFVSSMISKIKSLTCMHVSMCSNNYEYCIKILILIRVFLEPRSSVSAGVEMCVVSQQECADLILTPHTIHHTHYTPCSIHQTLYTTHYTAYTTHIEPTHYTAHTLHHALHSMSSHNIHHKHCTALWVYDLSPCSIHDAIKLGRILAL